MSRDIKVPHTGGLVNLNGEDVSLFVLLRVENDHLVYSYSGPNGTGVWGSAEDLVKQYRNRVTGDELIGLFDKINPDIWDKVENSNAQAAKDFREALSRNANRRISLTIPFVTEAFAAMVAGVICSQDDIDQVSLGIEL